MRECDYEDKLQTAWQVYGDVAGDFVSKYDSKFRGIITKYCHPSDFDDLYSNLVLLSIPVFIENWDCTKRAGLLDWICFCIYIRVKKHNHRYILRLSRPHTIYIDPDLFAKECDRGILRGGISIVEDDIVEGLTEYESYLLDMVIHHEYSISDIAKANGRSPNKIRADYRRVISKCQIIHKDLR